MIIDIHTHTFPDKIATSAIAGMEQDIINSQGFEIKAHNSGKYNDLSLSSKENNIDISVVAPVATKPEQVTKINNASAIINEKWKESHVFYFGAIHPDCDNYKEIIDQIVANDMKGIKIHPDYQKTFIDDDKYLHILDYAAEKELGIIVHAGEDVGLPEVVHCTPDGVLNMYKHVKPPKLILAHMGGWRMWDEVEEKLVGMPFYFDTAVCLKKDAPHLSNEQFERIVDNHGASKILFGTDSPWYDQKLALNDFNKTNLSLEDKKMILGENANKLFNLL